MSEEHRETPEPQVKVVDRRRFRPDGEPVQPGEAPERVEGASEAATAEEAHGLVEADLEAAHAALQSQKARIDELTRAYAALVEDNKAFRQRLEREKARVVEAERIEIAQTLLDAADDLERALAAAGSPDAEQKNLRSLVEGVRLSLSTLHKRIADLGAERIPVSGELFDPRVAEAVDTVAISDAEQDGRVVQEVRPGYRIGERILRPARVRVGRLAQA